MIGHASRHLMLILALLLALLLAPTLWANERPTAAGIASANTQATAAGFAILEQGGNAFDAAVAVSAALSVVEPESSGLGGGGFFLLYLAKTQQPVFIDARERAPAAASRDMYLDANGNPLRTRSIDGPMAAAIPGLPAAMVLLAERHGRLPLRQSLQPAITLAEKGYIWSAKNAAMMGWRAEKLGASRAAAALFLPGGKPPKVGDRLRNRDIAKVLRRLGEHGHKGFYEGQVAKALVHGVRAGGGIWTLADLKDYRVVEREAMVFRFRDQQIITAPPPSSGGVALAAMFNILSGYPIESLDRVTRLHLEVEAMRRVYRDRAIYLGDPDFVAMPLDMLTSPYYAAGMRASIRLDRATPSAALPGVSAAAESEDTTHFSIIDSDGNIAAVTQTVNLPFGSAFVAPGTGFLLNNEMDDFSVKPGVPNAFGLIGDDANAIAPGKRPLSSMTPTILIGKDRVAAIGTPGGSRIITMVYQGLTALINGASAADTVAAARIHHQYEPDQIAIEPDALTAAEIEALSARGHRISAAERPWGNMNIVLWDLRTGAVEAASDPRWKGVGGGESRDRDAIYR